MDKAAGTRRVSIPNLESPAGTGKEAGGNGKHEERPGKLAEALKQDRAAGGNGSQEESAGKLAAASKLDRGGGSELTPRSRASWASQVEEEHEATDWTGLPRHTNEEEIKGAAISSEMPDDASKKSKKKKKKKSRVPSSVGEDIPSSPASGNQKSQATENVSSLKGNGIKTAESVDKKGRSVDAVSSPAGRIKGSNAVRALKRSDSGHHAEDQKVTLLPGSSGQPVGAKDTAFASPSNESWDSGWEVPPFKHTDSSGGSVASPSQAVNDDSGWKVAGPRRTQGQAVTAAPAGAFPNGKWDQPLPTEVSSNGHSGWEVAGSRRGKKGGDFNAKSPGGPNAGQKGKGGRGQPVQPHSSEYFQRGSKQSSCEWERVDRGVRSLGHGFQEKVGRRSPRKPGGPCDFVASRQAPASQLNWAKPLNEVSNWDSQPVQGSNSGNSGTSAVNSANFLRRLLPQARAVHDSNPGTQSINSASIPLDEWKGGFPAFSGNGSSVFDDYPEPLYSDSQCSDDDLDSDTMSLASFDSEDSHKSHSTQRSNKWFRNFFLDLDGLTEGQLHEHDRQWHCPACQGGVGAIDWYRGLQPLLAHAKTVRSKRVKVHKSFAEVLEEEIRIRGAAPGTHGSGKYGKWRGLGDENESKVVVWPPMVVVRNTQLEQDEDDKWIGMGNKELLDLFKKHNPVKARHAYGPQGHRGISILIFGESPTGYYNAQRLETQFNEARRGKDNWEAPGKLLFQPGGNRILYGYMATADDLDFFNKHSKGKQTLKWEHKSFQDMVLSPMRRLDEENNKVTILQGKVQREMEATKALKKTMSVMSKKLVQREDELKVIRDRAREQHQQQVIEMEDMETLYKEKIEQLKQEILEKEVSLERGHEEYEQEHMQQCEKLEQQASKIPKGKNLSDEQQQQQALMEEEIARHSQLVEMSIKNQEQWEARKVELLKEHHQKMMDFKSHQWEDLIKFESKLDQERIEVMEAFKVPTEKQSVGASSSSVWR